MLRILHTFLERHLVMRIIMSIKVKTALLTIQRDFENRIGFSPIAVRPIPLFSQGLFQINENGQKKLNRLYPDCVREINSGNHICKVQLDEIWKKKYSVYLS